MKRYKPMCEITTELSAGKDVVKFSGDLAWDTVERANGTMSYLLERDARLVVIDLSGLEFIDSKGIGFLVRANRAFNARKKRSSSPGRRMV